MSYVPIMRPSSHSTFKQSLHIYWLKKHVPKSMSMQTLVRKAEHNAACYVEHLRDRDLRYTWVFAFPAVIK